MESNRLDPKEALKNKAFAKNKPNSEHFENFKVNLARLIDLIDEKKREDFHKNLISDFLKKTYYEDQYFINMLDGSILDSKKIKCFAKYANDAKGFSISAYTNNAKIGLDEQDNVCLIAIKKIKAGDEIFCSYGAKYWKNQLLSKN
jgi:hypothetical protein